jgi:hypothetical protein
MWSSCVGRSRPVRAEYTHTVCLLVVSSDYKAINQSSAAITRQSISQPHLNPDTLEVFVTIPSPLMQMTLFNSDRRFDLSYHQLTSGGGPTDGLIFSPCFKSTRLSKTFTSVDPLIPRLCRRENQTTDDVCQP